MFLSRLILDVRSGVVRRWLSDVNHLHRDVLAAFGEAPRPSSARDSLGVLFRLDRLRDGRLVLLVQSRGRPNWESLPSGVLVRPDLMDESFENPSVKPVDEALGAVKEGDILRFRLRANPTRKVDTKTQTDGKRRNGRRVALTAEAARMDWLQRKATSHGFELGSVSQSGEVRDVVDISEGRTSGTRPGAPEGKRMLTFGSCVFEGMLRVTDVTSFKKALESGIGSGKAFGFGLLSVARGG